MDEKQAERWDSGFIRRRFAATGLMKVTPDRERRDRDVDRR